MARKKAVKKKSKKVKKINGVAIQFLPYSEIKDLDSNQRIKKILDIIFGNNLIILQGKLRAEEEARLIGDTMAMIGHVNGFSGIELAVIAEQEDAGIKDRLKNKMIEFLSGGNVNAITIIGPASVVKEMKRDPKKIELLLNK